MDGEAFFVDVGSVGLDAPVPVFVHVKLVKPNDNLRRAREWRAERDVATGFSLWSVP
jgi:hypothetical protein